MYEKIRPYTKATIERMAAMKVACEYIDRSNIEGDVVECGVWKGGHIMIARMTCPSRLCWLYDTFTGMPRPTARDVKVMDKGRPALETWEAKARHGHMWAGVSRDEVIENFRKENLYDPEKLKFIEGRTEQNTKDFRPDKIALLRLDTDWYSSTKAELENLWPLLVSGGVLIIDDYGHWRGAREAVHEYFDSRVVCQLVPIDYTAVMVVKEDYPCTKRLAAALKKELDRLQEGV